VLAELTLPPNIPSLTEPDTTLNTLPPLPGFNVDVELLSSIKLITLFELDT